MVEQRAKVGDRFRRVRSDLTEGRAGAEPDPVIRITERVDEDRYRHARQSLGLAVGITDTRHDVIGGTVRPTELAEEINRLQTPVCVVWTPDDALEAPDGSLRRAGAPLDVRL